MKLKHNLTAVILFLIVSTGVGLPSKLITKFHKLNYIENNISKTIWICSNIELKTYQNIVYNNIPITSCSSYVFNDFEDANINKLANESGCIYENENYFIVSDTLHPGMFRAYQKSNQDISVIANFVVLPKNWIVEGWAYKFEKTGNNDVLTLKLYSLKISKDTLKIFDTNENVIMSNINLKDIENALTEQQNKILGIEYDKKYFSSDEIKVNIFPNPIIKNTDELTVQLQLPVKGNTFNHFVKLFDLNGKLIKNESFIELENKLSFKNIDTGIYFIEIYTTEGIVLKKEKIVIN